MCVVSNGHTPVVYVYVFTVFSVVVVLSFLFSAVLDSTVSVVFSRPSVTLVVFSSVVFDESSMTLSWLVTCFDSVSLIIEKLALKELPLL